MNYIKWVFSFKTSDIKVKIHNLQLGRENTHHWKTKKINSTEQRVEGYCPLTPKEVGIFLQALGYSRNTWIYIAAGEIYGGSKSLGELKKYFPNLVFKVCWLNRKISWGFLCSSYKPSHLFSLFSLWCNGPFKYCAFLYWPLIWWQETVARPSELESFTNHASQSAALDYIVSVESDVFIPSYSGNMARTVEGHRRFLGHRKTINPNRYIEGIGALPKYLVIFFALTQTLPVTGKG